MELSSSSTVQHPSGASVEGLCAHPVLCCRTFPNCLSCLTCEHWFGNEVEVVVITFRHFCQEMK